jgi:BTB/POZ domain
MGTKMVNLYVGPKKAHFHVHEEILCSKIPYFAKMFRGVFAKASTKSTDFPEDDLDLFDILLGWVYQDSIRPLTMRKLERQWSWDVLEFYVLVEKYCLPEL